MKAGELFEYLVGEGCNPESFRVEKRGGLSDVFCLEKTSTGEWCVCYSERGVHGEPEFTSLDEEEAVEYFRTKILNQEHRHCVGFFSKQASATELSNRLEAAGIKVTADRIPYGGPADPRYRVFVMGKAIFPARKLLGDCLPKTDS